MRFALACSALLAGLSGCAGDEGTGATAQQSTDVFTSQVPAPVSPRPSFVLDGCPPDVNLMFEWLKYTPEIMAKIDKSMTGLEEPKCFRDWSMARTVMKNADAVLVLFKMDPDTGKWNPVAVGTDNICDALKVPADVQARLGPGC